MPDIIPGLSLGTAALVVIAACMAIAAASGIVRLLIGVSLLAASILAGFWTWQHGPAYVKAWIDPAPPWLASVLAVVAGILTFWMLLRVVRIVTNPFGRERTEKHRAPHGPIARTFSMALSLIPAAVLCFLGAALIRHFGSISELKAYAATQSGAAAKPAAVWLAEMKKAIDATLPADWFRRIDPLTNDARLAIAKWIAANPNPPPKPEIDPETGAPIPRAVVVPDPALQKLARDGHYSRLLRDPGIDLALKDPETRKAVRIILAKKQPANP